MQPAHRAQPTSAGRIEIRRSEPFGGIGAFGDRIIELSVTIVIEGKRRMHLGQREVGMLTMDFLRAPAVSQMIHGHLDHFDSGVINPRHSAFIAANMVDDICDNHGITLPSGLARSKSNAMKRVLSPPNASNL